MTFAIMALLLGVASAVRAGRVRAPSAPGLTDVPSLTDYGYIIVQVARRGNGQSFGSRRRYNDRTEAEDTYEITEWLAAQPGSDGMIGAHGRDPKVSGMRMDVSNTPASPRRK